MLAATHDGFMPFGGIAFPRGPLGDAWMFEDRSNAADELCSNGIDDDGDMSDPRDPSRDHGHVTSRVKSPTLLP